MRPLPTLALLVLTLSISAADLPPGVTQPLKLAPGANNPRNSEGDFAPLSDGRILFVYTHFTGGTGDAAAAHLAARTSADNGQTWSDKDLLVAERPADAQNIMSVSLLRLADRGGQKNRIALFYLLKKSNADCRPVMRISTDDGKTWTEPRLCMPDVGYFVVNNARAVQLKSGRILLPAAEHNWKKDKPGQHRGVACTFYSDDDGVTWKRSASALEAPEASRSGLQEPLVVELTDGRIMMLCRTDQGSQFRSYSADAGHTWEPAKPTDLLSPLSPASVTRLPKTGHLLMAWNDHTGIDPKLKGKRTPLTVAISKDDGQTWTNRKTLYADPLGWYCYTAIHLTADDHVLLAHCAGQQAKGSSGLATTVVTRFAVEWLYQ
ncbi:MAG TPA: sialidase family protein [Tepidisphaeraceae bacterium]|nr:sialidase family protein [Tepidisphaeraceae bacterium]